MDVLDILSEPYDDQRIVYKRYVDHKQLTSVDFNTDHEIQFATTDLDAISLLEESLFIIDVDILKKDGSRFVNADKVGITNNGPMFLFDSAKLTFDNNEIEVIRELGRTSLSYGKLVHDPGFYNSEGLVRGFYHDELNTIANNKGYTAMKKELIERNSEKGRFRFVIPFDHIFGFGGKILLGTKIKVSFMRKVNDDIIFRAPHTGGGADTCEATVKVVDMTWRVPFLTLSDETYTEIYSLVEKQTNVKFPFSTRTMFTNAVPAGQTKFVWQVNDFPATERPFGLILFFQTDKSGTDQFTSPAHFDHCHVQNVTLYINDRDYPGHNLNCSFNNTDFTESYQRLLNFRKQVLKLDGHPAIAPSEFKDVCPMFVFDISNQKQRLTGNTACFRLECSFEQNIPNSTMAYALVLSTKILHYQYLKTRSMRFINYV